jgi:hypothetical protein
VNRKLLANRCGAAVDVAGTARPFAGISTALGARVVWAPQWATTQKEALNKLSAAAKGAVQISNRSTLVLNGQGLSFFVASLLFSSPLFLFRLTPLHLCAPSEQTLRSRV